MIYNTKNGLVKVFAKTVEEQAINQILEMAKSPLGEDAHIRIMPDCHAGAGCVIGTTMLVKDKVCPNIVGVDIGCGLTLIKTDIDFNNRLQELDDVIREYVPHGLNVHNYTQDWNMSNLLCWDYLKKDVKERAVRSLGTLGGGNHFIEAYNDGWIAVHTGSRNIGLKVAEYYQNIAKEKIMEPIKEQLFKIEPKERQTWLISKKNELNYGLAYLTGKDKNDYMHDIDVMQSFADDNRKAILSIIIENMGGTIKESINSVHNYIDVNKMILRKGAISANEGEILVIPMNMRDGLLICKGKGNEDWNYSAPHGAGRLYSRSKAKELFNVDEYKKEMNGIYSSCINESTLDEAPFVYKDCKEIIECIEPTVEIIERLPPIFNFKAN